MSKPICRVGKIKRSGSSTLRSCEKEHRRKINRPGVDSDRIHLNRYLVDKGAYHEAAQAVLVKAGIDVDELRKDATIANDIVLSVSPEWFRPDDPEARGTWDENRLKVFEAEAQRFLKERFGGRLIAAVLHLDEATPHIQAVVVPIMPGRPESGKKWRLSGKDMFNRSALVALQNDWEDRLRPHGVGPRTKGSTARHTTLKEYYGVLEAARLDDVRDAIEITEPPSKRFFEAPGSYESRVNEWKRSEEKRIREELRPMAIQASRGRLYDAERRAAQQLRGEVAEKSRRLELAYEQISLDKSQIDKLRKTPINEVAIALDFTGEVKPKENAIDLVKRVGGLDYQKALSWLAQRFGPETAATAAREHALADAEIAAAGPVVLSKADSIKNKAITEQLDALAAPEYRVTIMEQKGDRKVARNLGKRPEGEAEKFFSPEEVKAMIPELTVANARGGNIFITPIDSAVRHVLIDDLKGDSLVTLRERGYAPALVLETSPNNFQAVLKVPAALRKDASNEWFKDLNKDLGDEKITGLVHPMRLAGFQNRKEKHAEADDGRRPFVRVVEAVNRICVKAISVIQEYARKPGLEDPIGSSAERGGRLGKRQ